MVRTHARRRKRVDRTPIPKAEEDEQNRVLQIVSKSPTLDPVMLRFYLQQSAVISTEEWPAFVETLARPLPTGFWVNDGPLRRAVQRILEANALALPELLRPGHSLNPHGYRTPVSIFNEPDTPDLDRLKDWLTHARILGLITRQTQDSMLPPLLLDVQPDHAVLDCCAAPGGKTIGLLEGLYSGDSPPTGFVLANELKKMRTQELHVRMTRYGRPGIILTRADFLKLRLENPRVPTAWVCDKSETTEPRLMFDRILCDVPCSGDGSGRMRIKTDDDGNTRNTPAWRSKWATRMHQKQLEIVLKAERHLKKDGLLCYSTCSMNPVENEAVVLEFLRKTKGRLEPVDLREHPAMGKVKFSPGARSWLTWKCKLNIKSEEPPTAEELEANPILQQGLDSCARIMPHFNDSGGFFVALFRKTRVDPALANPERHVWNNRERDDDRGRPADFSKPAQHPKIRKKRGFKVDVPGFEKVEVDHPAVNYLGLEDIGPFEIWHRPHVSFGHGSEISQTINLVPTAVARALSYLEAHQVWTAGQQILRSRKGNWRLSSSPAGLEILRDKFLSRPVADPLFVTRLPRGTVWEIASRRVRLDDLNDKERDEIRRCQEGVQGRGPPEVCNFLVAAEPDDSPPLPRGWTVLPVLVTRSNIIAATLKSEVVESFSGLKKTVFGEKGARQYLPPSGYISHRA